MSITSSFMGFNYVCESEQAERNLKDYIQKLGQNPEKLPDVSAANYDNWQCDYDFDGVVSLELPLSIKTIGKCVFAQSKLQNLLANGVEHIDELAFYNTKYLQSVQARNCKYLLSTDPETGEFTEYADCFNHSAVEQLYLDNVEIVGKYCFYDMPNIVRLNLPKVKNLQSHAIYGNRNLKAVNLNSIEHADFAVASFNPVLEVVTAQNLKSKDSLAFFNNGENFTLAANNPKTTIKNADETAITIAKSHIQEARETQTIDYKFSYRGFKYNLVEDLTAKESQLVHAVLESLFDDCLQSKAILNNGNMKKNESADNVLHYVKDLFVPQKVNKIGDYAFAKCYNLNSIVADGVEMVGDHAFYCNFVQQYTQLNNCIYVSNDAFNGVACDLEPNDNPKIFLPKANYVGRHAFWVTGYIVLDLNSCSTIMTDAISQNPNLTEVNICFANNKNIFTDNVNLQKINAEEISKDAVYGSPALQDYSGVEKE